MLIFIAADSAEEAGYLAYNTGTFAGYYLFALY